MYLKTWNVRFFYLLKNHNLLKSISWFVRGSYCFHQSLSYYCQWVDFFPTKKKEIRKVICPRII
jgi:hypothetical protein